MATMALFDEIDEQSGGFGADFVPLTAPQARELRQRMPGISPWKVIALQVGVGCATALLFWAWVGSTDAGWSAAYGALTVVIPGALFARGLMSRFSSINPVTAGFGFFVWEAAKLGVSVVMLFMAPKVLAHLDWLAMLVSLLVTAKVYWVALLMRPRLGTN